MKAFGHRIQIALLIALTIAVYLNSFKGTWHFDDEKAILENQGIKHIESIPRILRGYLDRPILQVTFALNYHFGGLNIWGYHLVNLLLHVLVVLLIYAIGLRLIFAQSVLTQGAQRPLPRDLMSLLPFWSALLYAVHPIHTESVTYVVSRSSVLATFFYMVGFWGFLWTVDPWRGGRTIRVLLGIVWIGGAFLLGLGTKEIIITLPVMALVYLYLFVHGGAHLLSFIKRYRWIFIAFGLAVAAYLTYRHTHGGIASTLAAQRGVRSMTTNLLTECTVVALYYLPRLMVPLRLNVDPDLPVVTSLLAPDLLLSFLVLGGLIFLAYHSRQRGPCLSFGILWLLITLTPTSSIIPLLDVAAEHRLYLPGVGFCLAWVYAILSFLAWLPGIPARSRNGAATVLLSLIALGSSVGTVRRNTVYYSAYALWKDTVTKSPNKWRPHNNLADAYEKMGKLKEAEQEYRLILSWDAQNVRAHYGLGNVYQRSGRYEQAVEEYKKALVLRSKFTLAYNNLGSAYDALGRSTEAEEAYRKALELDPSFIRAYNNLAILYAEKGALDQALKTIQQALRRDPNYAIGTHTLGRIYLAQGRYEEAIAAFERSLKIKPDFIESLFALGEAEQRRGNVQRAVYWYTRVLTLNPRSAQTHRVLGGLYLKAIHDPQKAAYHLRMALQIDPASPDADAIRSVLIALDRGKAGETSHK